MEAELVRKDFQVVVEVWESLSAWGRGIWQLKRYLQSGGPASRETGGGGRLERLICAS